MFSLSQRPAQSPVSDSNPRNGALLPDQTARTPAAWGRRGAPEKGENPVIARTVTAQM